LRRRSRLSPDSIQSRYGLEFRRSQMFFIVPDSRSIPRGKISEKCSGNNQKTEQPIIFLQAAEGYGRRAENSIGNGKRDTTTRCCVPRSTRGHGPPSAVLEEELPKSKHPCGNPQGCLTPHSVDQKLKRACP